MSKKDHDLKKVGLKVTLPRIKILQILESTPDWHMTAEDIYQALRDAQEDVCLLYTSPSPRDKSSSRMPSSA